MNSIFNQAPANSVPNTTRFYVNRTLDGTGTVFTGLNIGAQGVRGAYRYNGPFNVDNYDQFEGLPFRVVQPDGGIKENTWYQPASIPLERLSGFGSGYFALADDIRVTGQAMFTRTENRTRLGATADTIGVWGAEVPHGTELYRPSVTNLGVDGLPNTGDTNENMLTLAAYRPGGLYQLNCPDDRRLHRNAGVARAARGRTADAVSPRRASEREHLGEPDAGQLRYQLGDARGSTELHGHVALFARSRRRAAERQRYLGRHGLDGTHGHAEHADRLRQAHDVPADHGVAELTASDSSAIRIRPASASPKVSRPARRAFRSRGSSIYRRIASRCCTPPLQNQTIVDQNSLEANLVGDLARNADGCLWAMPSASAIARTASRITPDNLIRNGSTAETVAGTFPNTVSDGEFDVAEIYGELLIPIVADGPPGFECFQRRARRTPLGVERRAGRHKSKRTRP